MSIPALSICTPTYNGARYIAGAIESVLAQDFDDFELVICDDGSSDETPDVVRRYADPRIRYLRFANAGQSGNFNRCIAEARGEFFVMLHDDDFFRPGFAGRGVAALRANPAIGFTFGAIELVDADGRPIGEQAPWSEDRTFAVGQVVEPLLGGAIFNLASLLVRTDVARRAGDFRGDLTWGHDWDWTLRLAALAGARYFRDPLVVYRVHGQSGTAAILKSATNGRQERTILREALARTGLRGGEVRRLRRFAFRALARRHMYFAAQALLAERPAVARYNLGYGMLADPRLLAKPTWWALGLSSLGAKRCYLSYRRLRALVQRTA